MLEQVNVILALDVVYVHGTVNGVEADFALIASRTWAATVPKAEDGRYEVEITAYNSLGTESTYTTTIHKLETILPMKTDWTAPDIYGADDLNRVEANTQYLADVLVLAGYPTGIGAILTNRVITDFEFDDSLNRVEGNIDALHTAFVPLPGYRAPKAWTPGVRFDYTDANRLERNLALLDLWLGRTIKAFKFCGTFSCGEGGEIH